MKATLNGPAIVEGRNVGDRRGMARQPAVTLAMRGCRRGTPT